MLTTNISIYFIYTFELLINVIQLVIYLNDTKNKPFFSHYSCTSILIFI